MRGLRKMLSGRFYIFAGMIYYLIFILQLAALSLTFYTFTHPGALNMFYLSMACFALSVILVVAGILTRSTASRINCFTIILVLLNILLYVLFLFTGYLGEFNTSGI